MKMIILLIIAIVIVSGCTITPSDCDSKEIGFVKYVDSNQIPTSADDAYAIMTSVYGSDDTSNIKNDDIVFKETETFTLSEDLSEYIPKNISAWVVDKLFAVDVNGIAYNYEKEVCI